MSILNEDLPFGSNDGEYLSIPNFISLFKAIWNVPVLLIPDSNMRVLRVQTISPLLVPDLKYKVRYRETVACEHPISIILETEVPSEGILFSCFMVIFKETLNF